MSAIRELIQAYWTGCYPVRQLKEIALAELAQLEFDSAEYSRQREQTAARQRTYYRARKARRNAG